MTRTEEMGCCVMLWILLMLIFLCIIYITIQDPTEGYEEFCHSKGLDYTYDSCLELENGVVQKRYNIRGQGEGKYLILWKDYTKD